jgi:rhodanese-related sulfurtransferase
MSVPEIQVDELEALLAAGAPLFDVRQPDEYAEERVPGAVLVPLGEVADALEQFPTDRSVYVICRSGGRSLRAAELLRANGVDAVNVAGGTMAWVTSGRAYDSDAATA